jgi:integrase/recombinase XerD
MAKFVWQKRLHSLNAPEGPLVNHLAQFERLLIEHGYPHESTRRHLRLIADFSVWLKAKRMALNQVTRNSARRYLRCRARYRPRRAGNTEALHKFVELLEREGLVKKATPVAQTPAEQLVTDYSSYLHQERGLAARTISRYTWVARLFLAKQHSAAGKELSGLNAQGVIHFIQSASGDSSAPQAKNVATGLRSFLRYTRYRGYTKLDLAAAVPRVASWCMTSIPKAIAPENARRVLASCDRRRAVGRRDYAMLMLLARLGLRAGEVASLTLDDIDWHAGTLTVHGKGAQESPLPLLAPVGEAIAAYLTRGRPRCQSRRLFLRMHAPIRGFKTEKPVSTAVGRALARAGIDSPHRGAHQFRHALAGHMLRHGSSFAEIGEILRHKSPDTTRIYAKVDLTSLRALAPPWPRVRR